MKKWFISAAIFAAALFPQAALADEEITQPGSWLILFFFSVNFFLFVYVLVRFAAPAARQFFADRSRLIRNNLSRSQEAFAQAQDMANQAAAKMATLEAESRKLAAEMEDETAYQVRRIAELARTATDRIRRDTEVSGAALFETAQRRVRNGLAEAATALARELITRNFEGGDQGRLIDSFMDRLGRGANL